MGKPSLIRQHSDDGDMLINPKMICAVKLSNDTVNYKVLLSNGKWYRTFLDRMNIKNYFDVE